MKSQLTILIATLLISVSSSGFYLDSLRSFNEYEITTFACAPSQVYTYLGTFVDMAIGLSNGSVLLINAYGKHQPSIVINLLNDKVQQIIWNKFGIIACSAFDAFVYDPQYLEKVQTFSFINSIYTMQSSVLNSENSKTLLIAFAFYDSLHIYKNSTRVFTKDLDRNSIKKTMCFDDLGRYLYYFDGYTRYVYDISQNNTVNTSPTTKIYLSITPSRNNNNDITAAINQDTGLEIWNNYIQLASYSTQSGSNIAEFTELSNFLVTYSLKGKYLTFWKTDFNSFNNWRNWYVYQTQIIQLTILKIECKDNKVYVFSKNKIYIYHYYQDSQSDGETLLEVLFFSFICCCVTTAFCIKQMCKCCHRKATQLYSNQEETYWQPEYIPPSQQNKVIYSGNSPSVGEPSIQNEQLKDSLVTDNGQGK